MATVRSETRNQLGEVVQVPVGFWLIARFWQSSKVRAVKSPNRILQKEGKGGRVDKMGRHRKLGRTKSGTRGAETARY